MYLTELSTRETQVLELLPNSNAVIGQELGIATQTVKNTITNIARKLGCFGNTNKRTAIMCRAIKLGCISVGQFRVIERREDSRHWSWH